MKSTVSSLSTGIAWLDLTRQKFRHEAQQDDIKQLDWIEHDGSNYGTQELSDTQSNVKIETTFVIPSVWTDISSPSWIQKISVAPLQEKKSVEGQNALDFPFYYYLGSDCFNNDPACLLLSSLTNIQILTKEVNDEHLLFYITGQKDSKERVGFRVYVNQVDAVESFSFQASSEKNVFSGVNTLKNEIFQGNNAVSRNKQDSWFDEFGELKNHLPVNGNVKFIALQLRIRKPVDLYFTLAENVKVEELNNDKYRQENLFSSVKGQFNNLQIYYSTKFQERLRAFLTNRPSHVHEENLSQYSYQIQVALSSLLGGIGYFEGRSRIEWNVDRLWDTVYPSSIPENETAPIVHQPSQDTRAYTKLLTATPSRTIFPRGFLWDEGFHQLVINHWNVNITMRVISDWLNAMFISDYSIDPNLNPRENSKRIKLGWIPREMILGDEAQQRVPDEFITQRLNIANPPTFLLVLESILHRYFDLSCNEVDRNTCSGANFEIDGTQREHVLKFLLKIFPRLHYWIEWFRISQASSNLEASSTFRWRGRSYHDNKVIPNTLSSGLDDYPRAIYPVPEERHVDLLCWMIKAYNTLDKIAQLLHSQYPTTFQKEVLNPLVKLPSSSNSLSYYQEKYFAFNQSLFENHYSSEYHGFYDYGVNNESSVFIQEVLFRCGNPETKAAIDGYIPIYYLQNKMMNFCPQSHPQPLYPMGDGQGGYLIRERIAAENYTYTVVPRVGYVSIFPFLLKILPVTSDKEMDEILTVMEDPKLLYTNYGLRSMATTDKFYLKRSSAHDAPYWRGPIWININFLALSALHHYGQHSTCKHQERIKTLYNKLRNGLIKNILKEQKATGFFWEQYDDKSGNGIRGHPFTGWTATIVNIFFEWY
eukprot:gene8825-9560_t